MAEIHAFIRVSTEEQNEERQLIRMQKEGIPKKNIVVEKESGKSTDRKKYLSLVKRLKAGDTLYIENVDRLGRDYDSILAEWHYLTKTKGIIIKVLDTPALDTDIVHTDLSQKIQRDMLLLIQAYQAHSEWDKIKSRQAQGIEVAKKNGKKIGRAKKETPAGFENLVFKWEQGSIQLSEILPKLKFSERTFHRRVKELRDALKTELPKGVPFGTRIKQSLYKDVL